MDHKEVARRLEKIREAIQDQLSSQQASLDDVDAPSEPDFELRPGVGLILSGQPNLAASPHLEAANRAADISAPVELRSGVRFFGPLLTLLRRIARPLVQPLIDPFVDRQQEFNAHAVRHLNAVGERLEQRVRSLEEALIEWSANPGGIDARLQRALEDYDAALRQRHTVLFAAIEGEVFALQNIGRDSAKRHSDEVMEVRQLLEKLSDQVAEHVRVFDRRFADKDRDDRVLEDAIKALNEELNARSRVVQDRLEEAMARLGRRREAIDRLEKTTAELLVLRSRLKTELRTPRDGGGASSGRAADGAREAATAGAAPDEAAAAGADTEIATAYSGLIDWMNDEDYRAFQVAFRGDDDEIRRRFENHVERFEGAPGVIADLGCGRGEFLDLLETAGFECIGVEINAADVADCRRRGHQAVEADLFAWLEEQDADSLGGIFAAQVIEHLPPLSWERLLELAATRLAPGGRLVLETINPESLYAMARAYIVDPTHVRPVHPGLLSFLARRAGFHPVDVELQAPVPDDERPAGLPVESLAADGDVKGLARLVRERLDRVDRLCCAPQEYTLWAVRAVGSAGDR